MRIVTDEKDRQAYKEFLEKHERCNFQQSPEWAKVKGNWINEIVLAEDDSKYFNKKNTYLWKYNVFVKRTNM